MERFRGDAGEGARPLVRTFGLPPRLAKQLGMWSP